MSVFAFTADMYLSCRSSTLRFGYIFTLANLLTNEQRSFLFLIKKKSYPSSKYALVATDYIHIDKGIGR